MVDSFERGLSYLSGVRNAVSAPEIICSLAEWRDRRAVYAWMGEQVEAINVYLQDCLQRCLDCFHPWEQPLTEIYAVPLDQTFGIDGFCDFRTQPTTLLIDVGRVVPQDWVLLVVHECAHAFVGTAGHDAAFARSLRHLCLGLEIAPPEPMQDLRSYPCCAATTDPLAFWRGESLDWRSQFMKLH